MSRFSPITSFSAIYRIFLEKKRSFGFLHDFVSVVRLCACLCASNTLLQDYSDVTCSCPYWFNSQSVWCETDLVHTVELLFVSVLCEPNMAVKCVIAILKPVNATQRRVWSEFNVLKIHGQNTSGSVALFYKKSCS